MTRYRLRPWLLGLALPWLGGCASDKPFEAATPFEKADDVRTWATASSAVGVYAQVHQLLAVADGHEKFLDAACPVVSDDDTTFTALGDCQDDTGHDWKGQATVTRDGDERALLLDAFEDKQGTFTLRAPTSTSRRKFEAHLVVGGVTTIDYLGEVQGEYGAATSWNGTGTVKREGTWSPNGQVDAATFDEVVDDSVCSGQPVSGSTILKSGSDTATITYDGADDCDSKQHAQLTVNGEDRGLLDGVNCAVVVPGVAGFGRASLALFALLLSLGRLRRRSRPTT